MVSVVKRPTGHKLIDQAITATVTDSSGDALVNFTAHSLTTGAVIYLTSDIDEYNGFWYVTVATADSFKISEYATADFVEYYQDADIEYYQTQEHDWSSIFLPIIYKLTNDKWPVNTLDAAVPILANVDDNGFTEITTPGPLRSSVNALEFVKISNADNEEANGIWQIVDVVLSNVYVLNLPYESSGNLIGATVQYYYNNFQTKVKIYAGLPSGHPWEAKKPYTEVAELSLTPDDDNEVMFSISDYISSDVKVRNNLTLYSLPLNLDAFTGFYIATAETYDQSDGYSLYTTDALFNDDSFEGYAIAGKLPFKNLYAGDYADYVYTSGSPARWLTVQERPLMVVGYFFDLSFIKNIIGNFTVNIVKYIDEYATTTEAIEYEDSGIGVYRIPITPDANYDSFCIQVVRDAYTEEVTVNPEPDDLSVYEQSALGAQTDWIIGDTLQLIMTSATAVSEVVGRAKFTANGATLKFNYNINVSFNNMSPPPQNVVINFWLSDTLVGFDDQQQVIYVVSIIGSGTVNLVGSVSITATADRNYIGIHVNLGPSEIDLTVNSLSFGDSTVEEVEVSAAAITEEICIDILETCDVSDGFTPSGIRLLEDGGYRLLE